jgi:DNA-binding FadR family transcriptional regulator
MRKPISKHALRRALERVQAEGLIQWDQPTGAVVDRVWHEIEKKSYNGGRKKPVSRDTLRDPALVEAPEPEAAGSAAEPS